MSNLWVTFSTDISGTFSELSGNIIYNLNNSYNFNGNLVDTSSNFIIYELSNNPIQSNVSLQANNWEQLSLNNNLAPFQGYWLGGINTILPQIFTNKSALQTAVNNWTNNPIPVVNIYGLIENWNVGNVTNMSNMFDGVTSFNQDLNNWNVGNVTNMSNMFDHATSFNQDLNNWNVGNVTTMDFMFYGATSFNQDLNNWNVGNVTNMSNMFDGATSFNQDISNWNIKNDIDVTGMFDGITHFTDMSNQIYANGTPYNYFTSQTQKNHIFTNNITLKNAVHEWITDQPNAIKTYGNISTWDVGNVIDMGQIFSGETNFNDNISSWNVENVTNMNEMFYGATSFNGNISSWNVENVTNMSYMFTDAGNFNQDINSWNVENVRNMSGMFYGATSFNGNISSWNVENVTDMSYMFKEATSFNQDISKWNIKNDIDVTEMFFGITHFTDKTHEIDAYGTPYNYFISQRNAIISVNIKAYYISESVLWIYASNLSGGFNAIVNALTISGMDKLVDYSFTSSVDSTSRDILEMTANDEDLAYYRVSGYNPNYIIHDNPGQEYTLYFTRRT